MDDITLNDQQNRCRKELTNWWKTKYKPTYEIGGDAGTGKSTIVYYLINELGLNRDEVLFITYTGKASLVLNRKGCNAKTIHSSIYQLVSVPKLDANGKPIMKNNRQVTKLVFEKRSFLPESIRLIVLDEGGMVNEKIGQDILSFNIPVIVLGDLNQLEPIHGQSIFLSKPDSVLTEILRQKAGDPIIYLSQLAKHGEYIRKGKYGDKCFVVDKDQITDTVMMKSDIIICGKNITRGLINKYIRENILKRERDVIYINDKVICRKNNWNQCIKDDNDDTIFLINGLLGYVDNIYLDSMDVKKKTIDIDFRPDFIETDNFPELTIDINYLFSEDSTKQQKLLNGYSGPNMFEWGNVITCHLSQGSQYKNTLVYNEVIGSKDYYRRWLYTAITRAEEGLILAM